jgi:tetratricopeptide (TPR) repeat protein
LPSALSLRSLRHQLFLAILQFVAERLDLIQRPAQQLGEISRDHLRLFLAIPSAALVLEPGDVEIVAPRADDVAAEAAETSRLPVIGAGFPAQGVVAERGLEVALARRLAADEPGSRQWQQELAIAQHNVARVLDALGRSDAALEAYQAALVIAERLAKAEPLDVDAQRYLLARYSEVGQLQERQGSRAEAQRSYCKAKAVVGALTDLEPEMDEWRQRRAWIEERLRATQNAGSTVCQTQTG